jgi:hypothetical protein
MNYYGVIGQGENHTVDSLYPPLSEQLVRLPLRIPASLKQKLLELAEREHRSLNKQIEFLLDRCIREDADSGGRESERARSAHGKRK